MTLRFAGKAPRLLGTASLSPLSFLLLCGCATGDFSIPDDESGDDAGPSRDAAPTQPSDDDASTGDDDGSAPHDANVSDTSPFEGGSVDAVRCGAGSLLCAGATPSCCETVGDGGSTYACVATHAACGTDYWIQCASAADCVTGSVCCHYKTSMKCETSCSSDSILACEPDAGTGCPAGKACSVTAQNGGQPSPYFLCAP